MWVFTLTMMLGCRTSTRANVPNYPTRPIELKYYADAPWAVTTSLADACCDSSGNKFDLYYPANLGAGGLKHPIIAWERGLTPSPVNTPTFSNAHYNNPIDSQPETEIASDLAAQRSISDSASGGKSWPTHYRR
jgi:hypothetical protein